MMGCSFASAVSTSPVGLYVWSYIWPEKSPPGIIELAIADKVNSRYAPPYIHTITGSAAFAFVPAGLAILRLRQSSDILVTLENSGTPGTGTNGCGHAAPGTVAFTVVFAAGSCATGGANRRAPAVDWPKGMFWNSSTPCADVPRYDTPVV